MFLRKNFKWWWYIWMRSNLNPTLKLNHWQIKAIDSNINCDLSIWTPLNHTSHNHHWITKISNHATLCFYWWSNTFNLMLSSSYVIKFNLLPNYRTYHVRWSFQFVMNLDRILNFSLFLKNKAIYNERNSFYLI